MTDEQYMQLALKEAQKAFDADEVPVGAIVVMNGQIIAKAHNQVELLTDSTAHAEILALTTAFNALGSKYLPDAVLYVTVEPCLMCAGALYWSKIGKIVWGADDDKNGHQKHIVQQETIHPDQHLSSGKITQPKSGAGLHSGIAPFHPKTIIVKGVLKEQCAKMMKDFFKAKR